jgi:hypothetical protein
MSAAMHDAAALYLPDVEANPKPGIYRDLIAAARDHGVEYGFNNRWITAAGVPAMSVGAHRRQGRMLAARGYIRD